MNVNLKCECGRVKAILKDVTNKNIRTVCFCDDCQSFAFYLKKAHKILDSHGGTEIVPAWPSQLEFLKGEELLQCMRLSPKGLLRWYTSCCQTPVANVPKATMPYAGINHLFMDLTSKKREIIFGPVFARIFGAFGKGPLPPGSHRKVPLKLILWTVPFLLKGKMLKQNQGPFFDVRTGGPKVTPIVISKEERKALRLMTTSPDSLL